MGIFSLARNGLVHRFAAQNGLQCKMIDDGILAYNRSFAMHVYVNLGTIYCPIYNPANATWVLDADVIIQSSLTSDTISVYRQQAVLAHTHLNSLEDAQVIKLTRKLLILSHELAPLLGGHFDKHHAVMDPMMPDQAIRVRKWIADYPKREIDNLH